MHAYTRRQACPYTATSLSLSLDQHTHKHTTNSLTHTTPTHTHAHYQHTHTQAKERIHEQLTAAWGETACLKSEVLFCMRVCLQLWQESDERHPLACTYKKPQSPNCPRGLRLEGCRTPFLQRFAVTCVADSVSVVARGAASTQSGAPSAYSGAPSSYSLH